MYICDVNGKPQCEQTVSSIEVYPGHLIFTIEAVVVGGDLDTTYYYGTINTKFVNMDGLSNTEFEASLESFNQYNQVVNTITKCTILNYTVYSNIISSEVLSLFAQEQSETILKQIDLDSNAAI